MDYCVSCTVRDVEMVRVRCELVFLLEIASQNPLYMCTGCHNNDELYNKGMNIAHHDWAVLKYTPSRRRKRKTGFNS